MLIAIVLSPAVALLVVVTKSSFCVHYVLLVERMLGCVGLHELLELMAKARVRGGLAKCQSPFSDFGGLRGGIPAKNFFGLRLCGTHFCHYADVSCLGT